MKEVTNPEELPDIERYDRIMNAIGHTCVLTADEWKQLDKFICELLLTDKSQSE